MGNPVGAASPISGWTETDLLAFIRLHMNFQPGGLQADGLLTGNLDVRGPMSLTHPIQYKGMAAPIVVSAASGPGYTSPWQDSSVSGHPKVQYSIDPFGWVHLRGMAEMSGIGTPSGTIFQLPPGFRPDKIFTQIIFTQDVTTGGSAGQQRVVIDTSGNVSCPDFGGTDARRCFFDGLKFPLVTNT